MPLPPPFQASTSACWELTRHESPQACGEQKFRPELITHPGYPTSVQKEAGVAAISVCAPSNFPFRSLRSPNEGAR